MHLTKEGQVLTIPKLMYFATAVLALGALISATYSSIYISKISTGDWDIVYENVLMDQDDRKSLSIGLILAYVAIGLHICHLLMQPCVCLGGDARDCLVRLRLSNNQFAFEC